MRILGAGTAAAAGPAIAVAAVVAAVLLAAFAALLGFVAVCCRVREEPAAAPPPRTAVRGIAAAVVLGLFAFGVWITVFAASAHSRQRAAPCAAGRYTAAAPGHCPPGPRHPHR